MSLGRGVSAGWLRVAIAITGGVVFLLPVLEDAPVGLAALVGLALIGSVYAPASAAPAVVVLGAAAMAAMSGDDPLRPAVLVMLPAVHLFHVSCGLAGMLPVRGRLHPAALGRPALRVLVVQGVTFVLVGIAALLPTGRVSPVVEATALVGLVVIALLVPVVQRERRDRTHTRGGGHTTNEGATMEAWGEGRPHGS